MQKVNKSRLIQEARFLISQYRKSDPRTHRVDFTDEQGYLGISAHLNEKKRDFIQDQTPSQYRQRLEQLNNEVSRLAQKWKIFI